MTLCVSKYVKQLKKDLPEYQSLTVSSHVYHDAGASIVQELAYTLSAAVEYMTGLVENGLTVDEASKAIGFSFSVGSNYFFEIAKLRAARLLWANIVKAYNPKSEDSVKMRIHSKTSSWNKTLFDANVNMLRITTEAMSAVLGGCNALSVMPYDSVFAEPSEFSYRIAQNTQLVIKNESFLGKIVDPSAGAYYLENLTDSIATASYELFQTVEDAGGMLASLKQGSVQKTLSEMKGKREKNISSRKDVFLGTNQFPNSEERVLDSYSKPIETVIDKSSQVVSSLSSLNKSPITPVESYRGSESFETMRLATETHEKKTGGAPKVFLWTTGNLGMRKARATFVNNFFSTAGFNVIDNFGFTAVEDGMSAVMKEKPEIIVLCSSDPEYNEITSSICSALKEAFPDAVRLIAGFPKDSISALKEAGIEDFVHVKTNAIEFLTTYQKKLGLEK